MPNVIETSNPVITCGEVTLHLSQDGRAFLYMPPVANRLQLSERMTVPGAECAKRIVAVLTKYIERANA